MASHPYAPRIPHTTWNKPRSCWTAAGNAKWRYRSRAEARRVAKRLARKDGAHMEAYWCDPCDGWHVGHVRDA